MVRVQFPHSTAEMCPVNSQCQVRTGPNRSSQLPEDALAGAVEVEANLLDSAVEACDGVVEAFVGLVRWSAERIEDALGPVVFLKDREQQFQIGRGAREFVDAPAAQPEFAQPGTIPWCRQFSAGFGRGHWGTWAFRQMGAFAGTLPRRKPTRLPESVGRHAA